MRSPETRCWPGLDRGTTLVELVVAMSIFALAMSVVFGAVILTMRKSADVQKSADAASGLRIALAVIDRQVRSGNVLLNPANEQTYVSSCTGDGAGSGTCMRIFTQSNGSEKCVQWQVTADDPAHPGSSVLRTRSWSTTWQATGDLTGWSTVARGLTMAPGTYPFTLQGGAAYNARLLDVRLEAYDTRRKAGDVIQSSLSGRNTTYGYDSAQCTPVPPA
jgi:prepilin-type N-terminal cleavage/methylation domain-containing protein